ncbi:MAG: AbrB/MazE/SpoVT family DNA-binding domain-containing protein [Candidatus Nitrosocosmicus sp.]|nr:AbrB/MazE/SpoVT family DNA-binding domain-containing protein [Candidatus Nitrosocosmicus sp.]
MSEIRKIQGLVGTHSLTLVVPKEYANSLGICKGDYVKVLRDGKKIIIEKVEPEDE